MQRWMNAEGVQDLLAEKVHVSSALSFIMDKFAAPKLLKMGPPMADRLYGFNFIVEDCSEALRVLSRCLHKAKKHTFYLPAFVAELVHKYHKPWEPADFAQLVAFAAAFQRRHGEQDITIVMWTLPSMSIHLFNLMTTPSQTREIGSGRSSLVAEDLLVIAAALLRSTPPAVPDMYHSVPAFGCTHNLVFDIPTLFKRQCVACGALASREKVLLRCTRCQGAHYCSAECGAADWPRHKVEECAGLGRLVSLSEATTRVSEPRLVPR